MVSFCRARTLSDELASPPVVTAGYGSCHLADGSSRAAVVAAVCAPPISRQDSRRNPGQPPLGPPAHGGGLLSAVGIP